MRSGDGLASGAVARAVGTGPAPRLGSTIGHQLLLPFRRRLDRGRGSERLGEHENPIHAKKATPIVRGLPPDPPQTCLDRRCRVVGNGATRDWADSHRSVATRRGRGKAGVRDWIAVIRVSPARGCTGWRPRASGSRRAYPASPAVGWRRSRSVAAARWAACGSGDQECDRWRAGSCAGRRDAWQD